MLRRSRELLRVSPFALFVQDVAKAGKLKGAKNVCATAAKMYRKLSPAEKSALARRAKEKTFPLQEAYQRMAKREMRRLRDMPILKRQEHIRAKWASMRRSRASKPTNTVSSAKAKVKAASKAGKKIAKGSGK
ncbi:putative kinetoplast-associated protein p18-2 [Leishmania major strain Friedlin]|uniref:Putative kinetoplast-associated protein p18-2 n=1 Tax=Leishmania major TaxID=5664 RepID=Q4Q4P5_LEIMA|nr:putative kinetoplast-associated protein p18-2 [Leishmania major strain Friedlin]CAG9580527.1 kinetoplast-associated_protein_p18-2_-_putative [Leishmania major strain Friedlin]CAJ08908.1 putative kinetoplast-associated protein p18-2 [Leishmania major strain Friedlin]|eukprot:XP_001685703.1 putative kinetoplast-associated protein p18-2 [Leishmania major strain Friedlin]